MPERSTRTAKLDLRLTPEAKQKAPGRRRAAGGTVSEFVLESALVRADETLADRTRFASNADRWKAFLAALDAPPRDLPRLSRLLPGAERLRARSIGMTEPLTDREARPDHVVEGFDCGSEELNRFLVRFALTNQRAGAAQTYVALAGDDGRRLLFAGGRGGRVRRCPGRLSKGLARHPIPIMLLARLAVSTHWQGRGLGAGLLKDAMRARSRRPTSPESEPSPSTPRTKPPGRSTSISVSPVPADPLHLFLLIKEIKRVAYN